MIYIRHCSIYSLDIAKGRGQRAEGRRQRAEGRREEVDR